MPDSIAQHVCSRRGFVAFAVFAGLGLVCGMRTAKAEEWYHDYELSFGDFDLRVNDLASIYVGGNMEMLSGSSESEGVLVVRGDYHLGITHGINSSGGRVMWGLRCHPDVDTPSLLVGGNVTTDGGITAAGTGARIGGNAEGGCVFVSTSSEQQLRWGTVYDAYLYDGQDRCYVQTNMGRASALTCTTGQGRTYRYETFLDDVMRPMSAKYKGMASTGTFTSRVYATDRQPVYGWLYDDTDAYLDMISMRSMVLEATGDGTSSPQVFNTSFDELDRMMSACGAKQFELDVRNCPDDALIVINVRGSGSHNWTYGFNTWHDGVNIGSRPNYDTDHTDAFATMCARVLWNFPDASYIKFDDGYGILTQKASDITGSQCTDVSVGDEVHDAAWAARGNMMPGSILIPYGSTYVKGSTNGSIYVAGDLSADWWEHHAVTWIGYHIGKCALTKESEHDDWT